VIGLRAIVIDITERKKNDLEIKQKNEALERVTESIDSGLAVINKDYRVVWANKYHGFGCCSKQKMLPDL
jgi:PAS domain-containing protein